MMNKLLLAAAAALALAGCADNASRQSSGTPTPQSALIEPGPPNGNGCNFEDTGLNCIAPNTTNQDIRQ
jgi:hypothetical protein